MGSKLGSARENTWLAAAVAVAIAVWALWRTVNFARSDTVDVTVAKAELGSDTCGGSLRSVGTRNLSPWR